MRRVFWPFCAAMALAVAGQPTISLATHESWREDWRDGRSEDDVNFDTEPNFVFSSLASGARQIGNIMKAIGDVDRLKIMCKLAHGERSLRELQTMTGLKKAQISRHLNLMYRDGLVRSRRLSEKSYYRAAGDAGANLMRLVYDVFCANDESTCEAGIRPTY